MAEPEMLDVLIRGGTVVDGTGAPAFQADIGVVGQSIVSLTPWAAAGPPPAPARTRQTIDAEGRLVLPGWIDQHTHFDGQVTWDPFLSPSAAGGVTTMIAGSCGIGVAPVRPGVEERDFLLNLVEAVEDIPGAALTEGVDWSWETFTEYLDRLARQPLVCDFGVLVGHAAVRAYCLGRRASLSDRPGGSVNDTITPEEIDTMATLVREACEAGAMGFSTSRIILHRDKVGNLTPGTLAAAAEMLAIGQAVAEAGGGVIQGAFDFFTYDDVPLAKMDRGLMAAFAEREWRWIQKVAKHYQLPVSFGLIPAAKRSELAVLRRLEALHAEGLSVFGQTLVRPQGQLSSFDARIHAFRWTPTFQELRQREIHPRGGGGLSGDALKARMRDPEIRARILQEMQDMLQENNDKAQMVSSLIGSMDTTYCWAASYDPEPSDSVAAQAARRGVSPLELAYDLMADPKEGPLWRPLFGFPNSSTNAIEELLRHPCVLPGISDAGAHVTFFCDATAPTHLLTQWSRDRSRGPLLPLEFVVKKQTQDIAELYGLSDRGTITVGKRADLNVVNMKALQILPPRHLHDLPTQAARWVQDVQGYDLTMCAGAVTFEHGQATGKLPGGLLRNPRSARLAGRERPAVVPYQELLEIGDTASGAGAVAEGDARGRALGAAMQAANAGLSAMATIERELAQEETGVGRQSKL